MSGLSPIDSAWSSLKDDDKIEKILPLIPLAIGAGFGGLGAYTGAGGRFINPDTGKFDPGFHADPKYQDPLTGGLIAEGEVGGDSTADRIKGGAVGALQGINPFAATGAVTRGARGAVGMSRAQRAGRATARAKSAREASEASALAARRSTDRLRGSGNVTIVPQRQPSTAVTPQRRDELYSLAGDARRTSDKLGRKASRLDEIANQPTMYQNYGKYGRMAQLAGGAQEHLGPVVAGLAGAAAMSQMPQAQQAPSTGFASPMGSVGTASSQQTPVSGNADPYGMRDIWQDEQWNKNQFGGHGVQKGDNMFKNNIGEELLKEASDRMYKASCAQCNKKDCLGKMHCSMNKAECPKCGKNCKCDDKKKADDKKKPAHGMVIVIGSKAGPGPSTDGKRDKVDSEKDKKE